jgi:hypothetical protein
MSPVAGFALFVSIMAEGSSGDGSVPKAVGVEFDRAHEAAAKALVADYLLVGPTTSIALLGFLGFAERLMETVRTTPRGDPRRAEVLSKLSPMIESLERALPRFARLPRERHFGQQNLADVYTQVGVWMKKGGKYEIVNPGE